MLLLPVTFHKPCSPRFQQQFASRRTADEKRERGGQGVTRLLRDEATALSSDCLRISTCLSAEIAEVLGVLRDLHLLDDLSQAGTVSGTILSDDPDFLGALGLQGERRV